MAAVQNVLAEWPPQWLRGPLPICVSRVIGEHGPLHGYAITQHLQEAGLGKIGGGTLYPLLGRLERDGLVTTDWVAGDSGPAKKVYTLTSQGRQVLTEDTATWLAFLQITKQLIEAKETSA